jgi:hypothetical protein
MFGPITPNSKIESYHIGQLFKQGNDKLAPKIKFANFEYKPSTAAHSKTNQLGLSLDTATYASRTGPTSGLNTARALRRYKINKALQSMDAQG